MFLKIRQRFFLNDLVIEIQEPQTCLILNLMTFSDSAFIVEWKE